MRKNILITLIAAFPVSVLGCVYLGPQNTPWPQIHQNIGSVNQWNYSYSRNFGMNPQPNQGINVAYQNPFIYGGGRYPSNQNMFGSPFPQTPTNSQVIHYPSQGTPGIITPGQTTGQGWTPTFITNGNGGFAQ